MNPAFDAFRTQAWRTGDPITHRDAGITGFAKWTYPRKTDGRKFLRVKITSGRRAGQEDWEDGRWILGQGAHELRCRDCGYAFRSDNRNEVLCPACDRPVSQSDARSSVQHRIALRGNATPYDTTPAPVTEPPDDDFNSPF